MTARGFSVGCLRLKVAAIQARRAEKKRGEICKRESGKRYGPGLDVNLVIIVRLYKCSTNNLGESLGICGVRYGHFALGLSMDCVMMSQFLANSGVIY
jgi:hypothetical protein